MTDPIALAQLRHLYQNMVNGAVRDTASAKRIAEGLLAPAIEALERATPPAEQQAAPKAAPGEPAASAAKGAIMGAAYDFRDAHISGSMNLKCSAHAALEDAVDNALVALAAPQQEAQEPCPSCRNSDIYACTCTFPTSRNAAPQPAPAPLSDDTALLDGLARLNWYVGPGNFYCDEAGGMNDYDDKNSGPEELRQAIRAAIAAQGGKA